ncbi:O-Glycosyl hydrolase family 17 protein [Forsythia ovata]|uniref:glucan endo-1,3-beta-D-glucosidase n=1 Tax=Forsythia ovata TaxID=205694 RepID=A0ABD1X8B7_9LAMI
MEFSKMQSLLYVLLFLCTIFLQHSTVYSIGVNYGTLGNNLPPPAQVAQFLKDKTTIDRIKIFDVNPDILRAFAGTGIFVAVTIPNGEIPNLVNIRYARRWVGNNIKPFYPQTKINYILVGNEVLHWGPQNLIDNLVSAMRTLHIALIRSGIQGINVTTAHSLGILESSQPPSLAKFRPGWDKGDLAPMLQFLQETKSPFMVNPYPYFGYSPEQANFALFKPNSGLHDKYTNRTYTNMFDLLIDAVHVSMKKLGYGDVEIAVGETGWASAGEAFEPKCTIPNAASYNGGLVKKYNEGTGTPLLPRRKFDTYIFALFNENLKPGSLAEKNFGLFQPDFTPVYDIGIMRGTAGVPDQPAPTPAPSVSTPSSPVTKPPTQGNKKWCVPKAEATDAQLQSNIDFVCSQGVDCGPIQPSGACYNPNTLRAHASYAMNSWYQSKGRNDFDCNFSNTGAITTSDPRRRQMSTWRRTVECLAQVCITYERIQIYLDVEPKRKAATLQD